MRLITESLRLKLVEATAADIDLIYLLTGNKKVMEFFPKVLTYDETQQMVQKILHQYIEYGYCFWKVLLKPGEHFVGIAGLLHQEINGEVETEISYRVLPEYWNNGYATEAAKACKEYAENTLGKKGLVSMIHPRNQASIRVAHKLGAKKAKSIVFMGEEHSIYVYHVDPILTMIGGLSA
ncbi:MAG: GNAT family N-acetyltransferase [Pseudomonadota bacterium]